jgi:predicted DNA-binding protein
MQRTTVKISEELDARLRHEARRSGRTISEVTRDALERYLVENDRLSFAGVGRSGRSDISERVEEILRDEADR